MQIDCHYMKTYLGGIIKSFTIRVNPNSFPAEELIGILVIPFYRWEIGDQKCGGGSWLMITLLAQIVKNMPEMQETQVQSLGWEVPLGKGMSSHSTILA